MYKFLQLLFFLNINYISSTVTSFTFSSCGLDSDIAQNIQLAVDPPLPQDNYILYLNADFSKEITK
jgi:hypothetical protein